MYIILMINNCLCERHPVQEFLDAWTKLGLSERIKIIDPEISVPLDAFLDNPDHWLDLLSEVRIFDTMIVYSFWGSVYNPNLFIVLFLLFLLLLTVRFLFFRMILMSDTIL